MKRIISIVLAIVLLFGYGVRLYFVGAIDESYKIVTVKLGEKADLSDKYHFMKTNVDMNGYSVTIKSSFTKTLQEMVEEYGYQMTNLDQNVAYYYVVEAEFYNENGENPYEYSGIDLLELSLHGVNYITLMDENTYMVMNPNFTDLTFKLKPRGEAFTRLIPFPIYYQNFRDVNSVKENPPYLQVSTYPEMVLMETK